MDGLPTASLSFPVEDRWLSPFLVFSPGHCHRGSQLLGSGDDLLAQGLCVLVYGRIGGRNGRTWGRVIQIPSTEGRFAMTIPPKRRAEIDIREEVDIVRIDPLFLERQRNKYASRGVALVVLLNGLAAIVLLVALAQGIPWSAKPFADAMLVFAIGAVLGLASAFFAYLGRTFRLERPELWTTWRTPLRWLAVAAAIAGAVCFVAGTNMARQSVLPDERTGLPQTSTPSPKPSLPTPSGTEHPGP